MTEDPIIKYVRIVRSTDVEHVATATGRSPVAVRAFLPYLAQWYGHLWYNAKSGVVEWR